MSTAEALWNRGGCTLEVLVIQDIMGHGCRDWRHHRGVLFSWPGERFGVLIQHWDLGRHIGGVSWDPRWESLVEQAWAPRLRGDPPVGARDTGPSIRDLHRTDSDHEHVVELAHRKIGHFPIFLEKKWENVAIYHMNRGEEG
jgi:hypothetical protein